MKNKETIEILNDLLVINNDRVEGYEKAVKELDAENAELRVIFSNNAEQSKKFSSILQQTVKESGGDPETAAAACVERGSDGLNYAVTGLAGESSSLVFLASGAGLLVDGVHTGRPQPTQSPDSGSTLQMPSQG